MMTRQRSLPPRLLASLSPFLALLLALHPLLADQQVIDQRLQHLRIDGPREWSSFPQVPDSASYEQSFSANANTGEHTLELVQEDVKQDWRVSLGGQPLGALHRDENRMAVYFPLAPGLLVSGPNTLEIHQQAGSGPVPDDIRVGRLVHHHQPLDQLLGQAEIDVRVVDAQSGEPLPSRITLMRPDGTLQTVRAAADQPVAVRPGTIYTANGRARFTVPAGSYRLYAGRGFEYSLASSELTAEAGQQARCSLSLRREVPTPGYIACDTHIHSLTHSGHGDATVQERMITIAGEGIELAIATDHNVHVDHDPFARETNVRQYFTPVIGNEVTTPVGHFNIFPIDRQARTPDHTLADWPGIFDQIRRTPGVQVVILNHARDLHSGVRPFGPERYNWVVAEQLRGWPIGFNAVEIVNSSATQSDPLQLVRDWMGLLTAGYDVTPVGSSDSHDVLRHFVGQGRTYIRCDDQDPGDIDVRAAVENFLAGRVLVSYGLIAELTVEESYQAGDTATITGDELTVDVRVLAPHWIVPQRVELWCNGHKIREEPIPDADGERAEPGVPWRQRWRLRRPGHDVHLVALAWGRGIEQGYWRTAKPYQPTSPDWQPRTWGCSGAVWVDADGDGQRRSARDYAAACYRRAEGELGRLITELRGYDRAVAAHAAYLLDVGGQSPAAAQRRSALEGADPETRAGFRQYFQAWRRSVEAPASD